MFCASEKKPKGYTSHTVTKEHVLVIRVWLHYQNQMCWKQLGKLDGAGVWGWGWIWTSWGWGVDGSKLYGERVWVWIGINLMRTSGVTPIGQGWTNARGLRDLGHSKPDPNFFVYFNISSVRCQPSVLLYSWFFVNVHFAFHHCFVFNGNFS